MSEQTSLASAAVDALSAVARMDADVTNEGGWGMSRMNDRMELVALAHRRYPDMELPLALMCFQSDRRRAGLGALDSNRRRGHKGVHNYKMDSEGRGVRYHLVRQAPAGWKFPLVRWENIDLTANYSEATIKLVPVPERNEHLCVPADYMDLREQSGRRVIAATLREARKQIKAGSA